MHARIKIPPIMSLSRRVVSAGYSGVIAERAAKARSAVAVIAA